MQRFGRKGRQTYVVTFAFIIKYIGIRYEGMEYIVFASDYSFRVCIYLWQEIFRKRHEHNLSVGMQLTNSSDYELLIHDHQC